MVKIKNYRDIEPTLFESDAAKGVAGRVVIGKEDGAENFCMRVFELSKDGYSPKHSHDWEHEIFIHSGNGAVLNNGTWVPVEPGCVIFIPGNEEHQVKNMGEDTLVFVCLIPAGAPEL
jgi:quercetin dioxygenase-like cupin family protein